MLPRCTGLRVKSGVLEVAFPTVALLLVACGPGASHAEQVASARPVADELSAVVDSLVFAEALDRSVPGVAVTLVADGEVLLSRGYGTADLATGRAASASTPFNIASITKPFTAAVVLKLAAEGAVDLDGPAADYLDLPAIYQTLTLRDLLTHTSGIARDLRTGNNDDPSASEYRDRLFNSQPSFAPGTRFEYSNTGYTVLGWLIESVEGQPLDAVFRQRLFSPLGMDEARYRAHLEDDPNRARPHVIVGDTVSGELFVSGGFGSGGLSLSADDFGAFALALQRGDFLAPSQLLDSWTPATLSDGSPVSVRINADTDSYGFGWFLSELDGRRLVTHGGGITGFSANLYHFPDERVTVAVLANIKARDDGAAPVDALARRITEAYFSLVSTS